MWVPHDTRDEVVDYVARWKERTELPAKQLVRWIGIGTCKFYDWKKRYGKVSKHNAQVPRDHWLEAWGKQAIVAFHAEHASEGYSRQTHMKIDADIVACSPADKLADREQVIFDERDRKMAEATARRARKRQQAREEVATA